MAMVCPECKQLFEQAGVCPLCSVALLYHAPNLQSETPSASGGVADERSQWQQTPWGKIAVGLILAQGLNFGLQQLLTAGLLASGDGDVWGTLLGIVSHHAVFAFCLLIGGILSGAGQSRGIVYGSMVGFLSGLVSLGMQRANNDLYPAVFLYAIPVIHLLLGALGGAVGMLIWRPIPTLPELDGSAPVLSASGLGLSFGRAFSGPVSIGRVCAGAFLIVIGVVWSKAILEFLLRASNGTLTISSQLQAQLISMEITALVALIGAAFAGATTRNGLKHGMCVGIGAAVIVLGIQFGNPKFNLEATITTLSGVIIVALVGGWFGGQLFPPVTGGKRRRGLYYYS